MDFPGGSVVKNPPSNVEDTVRTLVEGTKISHCSEDPAQLKKIN